MHGITHIDLALSCPFLLSSPAVPYYLYDFYYITTSSFFLSCVFASRLSACLYVSVFHTIVYSRLLASLNMTRY